MDCWGGGSQKFMEMHINSKPAHVNGPISKHSKENPTSPHQENSIIHTTYSVIICCAHFHASA